jgi:hypothetical protein
MSLMKTGALHNDPYCFCSIEKEIFAEELDSPVKKLKLKLHGLSRGNFPRLGGLFSGKRKKKK